MARTSFSGPVRAGYQGGTAAPQQPLTPTTINTGEVIEVNQGTGAYGFYARVGPTVFKYYTASRSCWNYVNSFDPCSTKSSRCLIGKLPRIS